MHIPGRRYLDQTPQHRAAFWWPPGAGSPAGGQYQRPRRGPPISRRNARRVGVTASNTRNMNASWRERWPHAVLDWSPAWRMIPTRFPAVNLFDRVVSPRDFEALYALEAMTNDRLRTEVDELDLVPPDERCFGPGCGPIMAAFTHLNPSGSRFYDGSYGVFYCAREKHTAIAETRYHAELFLASTNEGSADPPADAARLYTVQAQGEVVDLRDDHIAQGGLDTRLLNPDDYAPGQSARSRSAGSRCAGHRFSVGAGMQRANASRRCARRCCARRCCANAITRFTFTSNTTGTATQSIACSS